MLVKGIDHLNLVVRNLNEAVDWYRCVFGFRIVDREEWEKTVQKNDMHVLYEGPVQLHGIFMIPWVMNRSGIMG